MNFSLQAQRKSLCFTDPSASSQSQQQTAWTKCQDPQKEDTEVKSRQTAIL